MSYILKIFLFHLKHLVSWFLNSKNCFWGSTVCLTINTLVLIEYKVRRSFPLIKKYKIVPEKTVAQTNDARNFFFNISKQICTSGNYNFEQVNFTNHSLCVINVHTCSMSHLNDRNLCDNIR